MIATSLQAMDQSTTKKPSGLALALSLSQSSNLMSMSVSRHQLPPQEVTDSTYLLQPHQSQDNDSTVYAIPVNPQQSGQPLAMTTSAVSAPIDIQQKKSEDAESSTHSGSTGGIMRIVYYDEDPVPSATPTNSSNMMQSTTSTGEVLIPAGVTDSYRADQRHRMAESVTSTSDSIVFITTKTKDIPSVANIPPVHEDSAVMQIIKQAKSAVSFHISRKYNQYMYGDMFNFQQLAGDQCSSAASANGVVVDIDTDGTITALHDGKTMPLLLGSIPGKQADVDQLRQKFGGDPIFFTLNLGFERKWAGYTQLLQDNPTVHAYLYPTIDYSAPKTVDLMRAVNDLRQRDEKLLGNAAYVHCKAGRGRSAVTVAAYLATQLFEAGYTNITPDQLEKYMQRHRKQVKLNTAHVKALRSYQAQLQDAQSFQALLAANNEAIVKREQEVGQPY